MECVCSARFSAAFRNLAVSIGALTILHGHAYSSSGCRMIFPSRFDAAGYSTALQSF